ncbi:LuxR C-terminal-related transcriptional regulator [Streptomyces sp. cmx-18-6]|uniref:helix-turn-helix transcriptional regulator n=1 Tax=Streptomyces sp. cmx-18-6 TaxID=2790930 RepID=UPI003980465E
MDLHTDPGKERDAEGMRWRALNPQIAAAGLAAAESRLRRLTAELSCDRQDLDELFGVYSALSTASRSRDAIEVFASPTDTALLIEEAMTRCRSEVISAQPGEGRPAEEAQRAAARDVELLGRGVRIRALFQESSLHHPPTRSYVARVTAAGADVRSSAELFGRLIVFDRSVAFVPHHRAAGGAAVVRDRSVVALLCEAFDHAWGRASPAEDGRAKCAELSDLHRTVLRLLSEGARDETIARRLGVSLRTCRKYVAEIFEAIGAESRFQAGYLAAHRGLLK